MIQSNHKEQMEELKKSNFDSRFYSLVYYKNDLLNAIKVKDHQSVETSGLQVFDDISSFFITELSKFDKEIDLNILKTHYHEYLVKINNKKAVLSIDLLRKSKPPQSKFHEISELKPFFRF